MTNIDNLTFDEYGYLCDPQLWDTTVAAYIAVSLGINDLGSAHLTLLDALRKHYLSSGALLPEISACRMVHLGEDCFKVLFRGYENAWKIAGLPDPGIQARTLMDNES